MNFNFLAVVWLEFISMTYAFNSEFSFPKVKGDGKVILSKELTYFESHELVNFIKHRIIISNILQLPKNLKYLMQEKNWCDTIAHHILHFISFFVAFFFFVFSLLTFSWWSISFLASYYISFIAHHSMWSWNVCVGFVHRDSSFSRRPMTTRKYMCECQRSVFSVPLLKFTHEIISEIECQSLWVSIQL